VTHDNTLVDAYNKRVITLNSGHVVSDREGGYVL
jgi:ABC-type ATPase involved in cell division